MVSPNVADPLAVACACAAHMEYHLLVSLDQLRELIFVQLHLMLFSLFLHTILPEDLCTLNYRQHRVDAVVDVSSRLQSPVIGDGVAN